jgi:hypothetical protein
MNRRRQIRFRPVGFATDSPLEGSGFELPVPREIALRSRSGLALHLGSLALRRRGPDWNGRPTAEAWVPLTQERHLAASSVIVTVSALRFFYHTTLKRPWVVEDDIPAGRQAKKLPVVLSQEEVARFLGAVDNRKHRGGACYIIPGILIAWGVRGGFFAIIQDRPSRAQRAGRLYP